MAWKKLCGWAVLLGLALGILFASFDIREPRHVQAQGTNRADCFVAGTATTTGQQITVANGFAGPGFDNRGLQAVAPCSAWHLIYYASQAASLGIQITYAPDLGGALGPGSFTAALPVSGPTPMTSVTGAGHTSYTFSPWINVNVTALTGAGAAIHWQLLGWRPGPSNDVAAPPISVIGNPGPSGGTGSSDPCQSSGIQKSATFLTAGSATTAQLLPGVAGKVTYICGMNFNFITATQTVLLITGTGATCGTSTSSLTPIYGNGTTLGVFFAYGPGPTITIPAPAGQNICYTTTGAAVNLPIMISFVQL